MSIKLNFTLLFLVVIPLLTLAVIGTVTVAFVARVGSEKTYELAFQALNHSIKKQKTEQQKAPKASIGTAKKVSETSQNHVRKKLYPEVVKTYGQVQTGKTSEECLEVVDDPDRLLECIRKANPSANALQNKDSEIQGHEQETAYLPLLDPSSSAAMFIRDNDNYVDYVAVRFTDRRSRTTVSAKLRFQNLTGPRFLVLHGPPNTEWLIDKSAPKNLTGILVLTREDEPTGKIIGAPEGVLVWRYTFAKKANRIPFIRGIIPKCHQREGGSINCVNGPRNIHSSRKKDMKTPFQKADDWSKEVLGQPLATLSSVEATKNGLVIVPMETITQTTRDDLERELRRAKLLVAERKVKLEHRADYEKRWYAERYATATADFHERPIFNTTSATEKAESIVVTSIYETLTKERRKGRNSQLYDSYVEYKARADQDVRPVSVRVNLDRPTILVLTSHSPVNWVLDISKPEMVIAVQIEGFQVSSISGLPKGIPIRIRSFALGDRTAAHYLDPRNKKSSGALARIGDEFSQLPLTLIANYRADAIEISEEKRGN